jgi:SHS2 domain-containing protein
MDWRERFALVGAQPGDASFVARGPTLESLFRNASEELLALTVERADLIRDRVASDVMLVETELDFLLPRFMNGLVYLRETGLLLLRAREVRLDLSDEMRLHCHLGGEIFDPDRHKLIREVTRVSTHPLRFLEEERTWEASVALHV